MISHESVEAAVFAVARNYGSAGTPKNTVLWSRLVSDVQTALEAAAPYMQPEATDDALRAAWDRGYATAVEGMKDVPAQAWDAAVAAMVYEDGSKVELAHNINPYRSQA